MAPGLVVHVMVAPEVVRADDVTEEMTGRGVGSVMVTSADTPADTFPAASLAQA